MVGATCAIGRDKRRLKALNRPSRCGRHTRAGHHAAQLIYQNSLGPTRACICRREELK